MSGRVLAAIVSVALASTSLPAAAQQPSSAPAEDEAAKLKRAEELFVNGKQLFKEGSYEAAILAFNESYELSKLPDLLYNIGNAYERLGDFANARKYLDQYRAFAPEKERETLTRRIQNIDQRLREQEEKAKAERDKQPPPSDQPDPNKDPTQDQPPIEPKPEPAKKERVFTPLAGALTGVAVLGVGLGVGLGVAAKKWQTEAEDRCAPGGGVCDGGENGEFEAAVKKQKGLALGADIGFAVAGAAAIAVIAVIAVNVKKKQQSRASVAPVVGPRGAGISFGLRF